ncbi:MmcQ/YjbR family DNA-binding protein [Phaeodactylibacter luteus]|uniref:MmcQ/YjbR family DNA-binding protein n=1 Tax=Phaeodactylibacter luteus TaxID=1564516 RepID=A0A5C6S3B8_9BACT|nr:MmcQ/YjbR family DNA-binding protein [Phaeodactylibacter luteus]TXB68965.1 MmcQ/YjbR family DNA-binding protein [Phaeodactylibacter luteus]
MDIESFRAYCLEKPGVTEDLPFGPDTLVFKVMGKMFALTGLDEAEFRANLKCDPDRAVELREQYPQIRPGWHMNKKHWNTVVFEDGLPERLLRELIDHSYELVASKLPKKVQAELGRPLP